jgi:hypothetical protein
MAQRLGDEYWLYIVENAATEPHLYTIQNPAAALKPDQVVEIVRFVVNQWKPAAMPADHSPQITQTNNSPQITQSTQKGGSENEL